MTSNGRTNWKEIAASRMEEIRQLNAEIKRLRAELETWKAGNAYHMTSPRHGTIDTRGLERHEG